MIRGRWRVLVLVLAVLAAGLGALYAAGTAGLLPFFMPRREAARPLNTVRPGFVGVTDYGHWHLICEPAPAPVVPAGQAETSAKPSIANTCRLNQEVTTQQSANQVIFAANLSLIGPQRKPAMMLRVPPTFHSGDAISLRLDGDRTLAGTVHDCSANECVAANALADQDWNRLVDARTMQIVFPVPGGQTAFVDLSVDGLTQAVAALEIAENVSTP